MRLQKIADNCLVDVSEIVAVYFNRGLYSHGALEICLRSAPHVVLNVNDLTPEGTAMFEEIIEL